mgnify:CR=1 FL=1
MIGFTLIANPCQLRTIRPLSEDNGLFNTQVVQVELVGVDLTVGGDASIEAEDVRIASAQDVVETRGGSVGLAVVNPGDILNSEESPLSVGVELSDSVAVAERSQVNVGGNLSLNARSGDAIIAGADGDVLGRWHCLPWRSPACAG